MKESLTSDRASDASLSRVFVRTRHAQEGFSCLDALVREGQTQHHAWGMPIVGPSRSGKTMLVTEYLRSCKDEEDGRSPLKYLYVELGQDAKPSNIASQTLDEMGDPNPSYGSPLQRTTRVIEGIKREKYDLIIYDEAHFLIDSKTKKVQDDGVAWFNTILNRARCPLILIGDERLGTITTRRANSSLAGRMFPFPKFRPYNVLDRDDLTEFRIVLDNVESQLGFPKRSRLSDPELAVRICITCEGRLGLVEMYLTRARQIARERSVACLTYEVLTLAARQVISMWSTQPVNPFVEKDLALVMARQERTASAAFSKD